MINYSLAVSSTLLINYSCDYHSLVPILLIVLWQNVNDCFAVNRSRLHPLSIVVTVCPVISLATGFIVWKFVGESKVSTVQ